MSRAKMNLKREKVQVVLQMEDSAQEWVWQKLEEMRLNNTLQSFLRNTLTEALPRPAMLKGKPELRYVKDE